LTYLLALREMAMAVTILLVDDTAAIRRALRVCIETETSWEICGEAENGKIAVEMVQKLHPAVVLLDLKMPKVDGLEVLRALKGDDALRAIPVVILTSSREERDLVESYRLGANAYVVKPVDFEQFVTAVKEVGMFWAVVNEPPPGSRARG